MARQDQLQMTGPSQHLAEEGCPAMNTHSEDGCHLLSQVPCPYSILK